MPLYKLLDEVLTSFSFFRFFPNFLTTFSKRYYKVSEEFDEVLHEKWWNYKDSHISKCQLLRTVYEAELYTILREYTSAELLWIWAWLRHNDIQQEVPQKTKILKYE